MIKDRAKLLHRLDELGIDRALLDCKQPDRHPLSDAATTIAVLDLIRFIDACGHHPTVWTSRRAASP